MVAGEVVVNEATCARLSNAFIPRSVFIFSYKHCEKTRNCRIANGTHPSPPTSYFQPHVFPLLCGVDVSGLHTAQFCVSSPTVPSPSSSHLHSLSTFTSVFLSFSSPPHPSSSLYSPTYSSSLLTHDVAVALLHLDISHTFVVPVILSILILSIFLTPHIHLNIVISATSNFFSCASFAANFSAPYVHRLQFVIY